MRNKQFQLRKITMQELKSKSFLVCNFEFGYLKNYKHDLQKCYMNI